MEYYAAIKEPGSNHTIVAGVGTVILRPLCGNAGQSKWCGVLMRSFMVFLGTRILSIENGDTEISKKTLNKIPYGFEFEWEVSVWTHDAFLSQATTTYFLALATEKA